MNYWMMFYISLGIFCVGRFLYKFLKSLVSGLVTFGIARVLPLSVNFLKYGHWAVITGATDGIGREFALQLAKKGLNIILVSRNPEKLNRVAKEIETMYNVETKCVQFDFRANSVAPYSVLRRAVEGLDIAVLVNNVGVMLDYPDLLHLSPGGDEKILDALNVNICAVTLMTRSILPSMLERKKGIVINLSSVLGLEPAGTYAVYSAAKNYCIFLTKALEVEYQDKGIIFQTVIPGIVTTNMSRNYRDAPLQTTADAFVAAVLSQVGLRSTTNGHWKHALESTLLLGFVPGFVVKWAMFKDSRKRKDRFLAQEKQK